LDEAVPLDPHWKPTNDDLAAIAAAYGLTTLDDAPPQPLGGALNHVLRIGTNLGDLVVRIHPPESPAARLAAVHAVQDALRSRVLPIPAILRTTQGSSWTTVQGRLTELSVYVPDGHQTNTWEDGEAAFAMIGRLHTALRTMPTTDFPSPVFGCYASPHTALAMLAESDASFRAQRDHPDHARAAAVRDATAALLHRLQLARLDYEPALPRSLIHGDLLGSNLLHTNGRVVAIFDFDRLAERERVFELAYALFHLLNRFRLIHPHLREATVGLTDGDLANVARLLRRYNAEADDPLTAAELTALPFEMARAPLYPIAAARLVSDEAITDPLGITGFPTAQWLADNASYVSTTLMSLVAHVADRRAVSG
jgi:Ser/Thr protein kinase RdoA (MazF antagonist)